MDVEYLFVQLGACSERHRLTVLVEKPADETERLVVGEHLLDRACLRLEIRIILLLVELRNESLRILN